MSKRKQMGPVPALTLGIGLLCGGCGVSLRAAVLDHAETSRSVATTLSRAAAVLRCEEMAAAGQAPCRAGVSVIEAQAQALRDSAERLQRAAR